MCSVIKKLFSDQGQATVEAAFSIPVIMVLLLMLLQPGILLYDKIIMENAAAESCRLLATTTSENAGINQDYIRRRLSAIPQMDLFHVHTPDCSWHIELLGDETSNRTSVKIRTYVKPLPLIDAALGTLGALNDAGCIELVVETSMDAQPEWVQSSKNGAPRSVLD